MGNESNAKLVEKLPKEKQQKTLDRLAKLDSYPKKELSEIAKPKPR